MVTIFSHLCNLFENGHEIDLKKYVSDDEFEKIKGAISKVTIQNNALKPIFDYLGGNMDYFKIRIVATLLAKKGILENS